MSISSLDILVGSLKSLKSDDEFLKDLAEFHQLMEVLPAVRHDLHWYGQNEHIVDLLTAFVRLLTSRNALAS